MSLGLAFGSEDNIDEDRTVSLPSMKVADQSGAPILVSAILNYYVEDAKQAIFNVENFNSYVLNNAEVVLKQVVGRYSLPSMSETEQINQAARYH